MQTNDTKTTSQEYKAEDQTSKLILGYWDIKGIAEPARWLLHYLDVPYTEENPVDWEHYLELRKARGLDFPNLPYLIDGDFKLTESKAIVHYIAERYRPELLGTDIRERATVLMISGVLSDILMPYQSHIGDKTDQKEAMERDAKAKKVDDKVRYLSKFLGDKQFLLGHLTIADFELATTVYRVWAYSRTHSVANAFEGHDNINQLVERIRNLEGVSNYIASDRGKRPLHTPSYLPVPIKED